MKLFIIGMYLLSGFFSACVPLSNTSANHDLTKADYCICLLLPSGSGYQELLAKTGSILPAVSIERTDPERSYLSVEEVRIYYQQATEDAILCIRNLLAKQPQVIHAGVSKL